MNTLRFKACRINGTAYVELFEGKNGIALIRKEIEKNRDKWDEIYNRACAEADRLNTLMGIPPLTSIPVERHVRIEGGVFDPKLGDFDRKVISEYTEKGMLVGGQFFPSES